MGGDHRGADEPRDDVAGAPAGRLAAQKKSLIAAERDETARVAWRDEAAALPPGDLIFIEETSTHTAMTRRRSRAPRGERALGRVPSNHGPNITLLAALTPAGIGPALVLSGALDSAAFTLYAERILAPRLRPGQVVILDNLSAHKSADARSAIAAAGCRLLFLAAGCRLLFLPAYSPDFTPIEQAFAKVKARLRAAAERTPDGLVAATASAIDAITAADARAFYAHCGFPLPPN